MGANVVLDHLRHQAGNAAADARDHVHDALASRLFGQRSLDRFDLAANAAYPGEQLLLLSDGVCHGARYRVPPYTMSTAAIVLSLMNRGNFRQSKDDSQKDDPPGGTT